MGRVGKRLDGASVGNLGVGRKGLCAGFTAFGERVGLSPFLGCLERRMPASLSAVGDLACTVQSRNLKYANP